MTVIDMTNQLAPILVALDVALMVSALAIVAHATAQSGRVRWARSTAGVSLPAIRMC